MSKKIIASLLATLMIFASFAVSAEESTVFNEDNSLFGKKALFIGDSISYGAEDSPKGGAWAGRIATVTGLISDNQSIGGAVLATGRGAPVIIDQINSAVYEGSEYDYVIMEGGVNDAAGSELVGTISDSFDKTQFNRTEFCGALEYTFATVKENFPNAKLGYISMFKAITDSWGRLGDMTEYYDNAALICEKWGVEYLDLFNNYFVNEAIHSKGMLTDAVHPTKAGYNMLYKFICRWMLSLDGTVTIGDVDCNDTVTATDALLILQHVVKKINLCEYQLLFADANEDAVLETTDALVALQIAVGKW